MERSAVMFKSLVWLMIINMALAAPRPLSDKQNESSNTLDLSSNESASGILLNENGYSAKTAVLSQQSKPANNFKLSHQNNSSQGTLNENTPITNGPYPFAPEKTQVSDALVSSISILKKLHRDTDFQINLTPLKSNTSSTVHVINHINEDIGKKLKQENHETKKHVDVILNNTFDSILSKPLSPMAEADKDYTVKKSKRLLPNKTISSTESSYYGQSKITQSNIDASFKFNDLERNIPLNSDTIKPVSSQSSNVFGQTSELISSDSTEDLLSSRRKGKVLDNGYLQTESESGTLATGHDSRVASQGREKSHNSQVNPALGSYDASSKHVQTDNNESTNRGHEQRPVHGINNYSSKDKNAEKNDSNLNIKYPTDISNKTTNSFKDVAVVKHSYLPTTTSQPSSKERISLTENKHSTSLQRELVALNAFKKLSELDDIFGSNNYNQMQPINGHVNNNRENLQRVEDSPTSVLESKSVDNLKVSNNANKDLVHIKKNNKENDQIESTLKNITSTGSTSTTNLSIVENESPFNRVNSRTTFKTNNNSEISNNFKKYSEVDKENEFKTKSLSDKNPNNSLLKSHSIDETVKNFNTFAPNEGLTSFQTRKEDTPSATSNKESEKVSKNVISNQTPPKMIEITPENSISGYHSTPSRASNDFMDTNFKKQENGIDKIGSSYGNFNNQDKNVQQIKTQTESQYSSKEINSSSTPSRHGAVTKIIKIKITPPTEENLELQEANYLSRSAKNRILSQNESINKTVEFQQRGEKKVIKIVSANTENYNYSPTEGLSENNKRTSTNLDKNIGGQQSYNLNNNPRTEEKYFSDVKQGTSENNAVTNIHYIDSSFGSTTPTIQTYGDINLNRGRNNRQRQKPLLDPSNNKENKHILQSKDAYHALKDISLGDSKDFSRIYNKEIVTESISERHSPNYRSNYRNTVGLENAKTDTYIDDSTRGFQKYRPTRFETISPFISDSRTNKIYNDNSLTTKSQDSFPRSRNKVTYYSTPSTLVREEKRIEDYKVNNLDDKNYNKKAFDPKQQYRGNTKYVRNPYSEDWIDKDANYPSQFSYNYKTPNGISAYQKGTLKEINDQKVFIIQGSYNYTSPDGTPFLMTYTADEFGFHPRQMVFPVQSKAVVDSRSGKDENLNNNLDKITAQKDNYQSERTPTDVSDITEIINTSRRRQNIRSRTQQS